MIDNYYLYKNINELDLHGCNRYEAIYKVDSFIKENIILKNHLVKIIHGKGNYILKEEIHKYLFKMGDNQTYITDSSSY